MPKFASGEWLGCFCLTEPHVGSDASAILCKAERDGDHWVLNGVKQFITSGKNAQVALVFAVTDKQAGKKAFRVFLYLRIYKVTWSLVLKTKWGNMLRTPQPLRLKTAGFL